MMPENDSCYTCRKLQGLESIPGGYVYEDDLVFSSHSWSASDQETPYLGAFIVEPKRHVPTWAELNDNEAETLGRVIRDVSKVLKKSVNAEHIYVFVIGHHVPHLHVWVVPRYRNTPRDFWGFKIFEWPDRPVGSQKQVEVLCASICSVMA